MKDIELLLRSGLSVMERKEKQKYQQLAAQLPCVSTAEGYDKWHETQRVLKKMH